MNSRSIFNEDHSLKSFYSIGFINLTVFNNSIMGLWNTKAGTNSSASSAGTSVGDFYRDETPHHAFDRNPNTSYTSYGMCNLSVSSPSCGEDTGLHFTLQQGPVTLKAFRFLTMRNNFLSRDPTRITIEGSNQTSSSLLMLGSVWTLIYNGSSGLENNPGRSSYGSIQTLANDIAAYQSYRVLVTSKRAVESSTQYAELELFG